MKKGTTFNKSTSGNEGTTLMGTTCSGGKKGTTCSGGKKGTTCGDGEKGTTCGDGEKGTTCTRGTTSPNTRKPSATTLRLQFRAGVKWQLFRKYMLAQRGYTCEFCGVKYARESALNVHHRYDTDYTNLDPSRFLVLCWTCHKYIHAKGTAPTFANRQLVHLKDCK